MVRITMAALCFLTTDWTGLCRGSAVRLFWRCPFRIWSQKPAVLSEVARYGVLMAVWLMIPFFRYKTQSITNHWLNDTALCTWRSSSLLRFFIVFLSPPKPILWHHLDETIVTSFQITLFFQFMIHLSPSHRQFRIWDTDLQRGDTLRRIENSWLIY